MLTYLRSMTDAGHEALPRLWCPRQMASLRSLAYMRKSTAQYLRRPT
jgi:hypothetical protein